MRKVLISAFGILFMAAPLFAGQPTRFIVGFLPDADAEVQESVFDRYGLRVVDELDALGAKIVEQEPSEGIGAYSASSFRTAAFQMMSEPGVYFVEEDYY